MVVGLGDIDIVIDNLAYLLLIKKVVLESCTIVSIVNQELAARGFGLNTWAVVDKREIFS